MNNLFRRTVAAILSAQIAFLGVTFEGYATQDRPVSSSPTQSQANAVSSRPTELRTLLQKSYAELFDLAPTLTFSPAEIAAQRKTLEKGKDFCVSRFKEHGKQYEKQIEAAQKDLKKKTASLTDEQSSQAHCKIQNLELLRSEAQALSGHAIPTAYDNLNAKLDVIEKWPALDKETQQEIG